MTLGTGQIRLIFHSSGKVDDWIQLLMISVRGDVRYWDTGLMNFEGMLSCPVEQSDLSFWIAFETSSYVAGRRWKLSGFSGSSSMNDF